MGWDRLDVRTKMASAYGEAVGGRHVVVVQRHARLPVGAPDWGPRANPLIFVHTHPFESETGGMGSP